MDESLLSPTDLWMFKNHNQLTALRDLQAVPKPVELTIAAADVVSQAAPASKSTAWSRHVVHAS